MKFLLDNCLSPRFAEALDALCRPKHAVEHLRSKFSQETPDEAWIEALAVEGHWVIVSGDPRIVKSPQSREVWRRSGLTAFFLKKGWMHHGLWEQCWRLVRWWPAIMQQSELVKPGAGFLVPPNHAARLEPFAR